MRPAFLALAGLALLGLASAAHADVVTVYNVTGTLAAGGTFSGTITVDQEQYLTTISAFDLTTASSSLVDATFNGSIGSTGFSNGILYAQDNLSPTEFFYVQVYSTGGGFALCTVANPCPDSYVSLVTNLYGDDVTSATMVPQTPEPASLVLLGTGVLSAAGMARRRFLKA